MKNKNNITKKITRAAIIASLYAGITLAVYPISFGAWQIRISEALTILPFYFPEATLGLFIGCLISNLITMNIFDIIFGSLATLISAYLTYLCSKLGKKAKILSLIPPVIINAFVISLIISYTTVSSGSFFAMFAVNFLTVFAGQAISCFVLGLVLSFVIEKTINKL